MNDSACRLTIPMRLSHGPFAADHVYLTFKRTGLIIEMLDVPSSHGRDIPPVALPLRRVDALGLGLAPEDFADGVAACYETARAGWLCESVLMVGVDDEGALALLFDDRDVARWLVA